MKISIPLFNRISLSDNLSLIPYESDDYNYVTPREILTDVIHHKTKSALEEYQFLLGCYPKEIKIIFEIGIKNGGSLCLWNLIFPNAKIYGIDIDTSQILEPTKQYLRLNGIGFDQINCLDEQKVSSLFTGPVDLFIDDGQHNFETVIPSFINYWKHVSKGGFYIIEDWHSFHHEHRPQLLKLIIDELMGDWMSKESSPDAPYAIHLFRNFIAINKK